ncbi:EAL domain-containing protein [Spirulina sp. CS-785/01]|uniref:EAL domain-containing protein n=1 Tax=Spirulina sp. CS-785/01 TaxID=3021716 RepID=UPI00232BFF2A|nr:EAL domain-containing protein [Spirulina sp. CS-785/01]MDB9311667.1 EAL domain-containing protein [Spirulina sp. CS-785/01]
MVEPQDHKVSSPDAQDATAPETSPRLSPEQGPSCPLFPDRETLLTRITQQIRSSRNLSEILQTIAWESRAFLGVDRVKVYHFMSDGSGEVIAEALHPHTLPSLLGLRFPATDIPPEARRLFIQTRQRVIVDVDSGQKTSDLLPWHPDQDHSEMEDIRHTPVDPCHQEYLKAMGVSSSLVIPILARNSLWGLFVAHHSQPRNFNERELQIIQLMVDQLSIAVAQSQLVERAQQQAEHEAALNKISTILHSQCPSQQREKEAIAEILQATKSDGIRLYVALEHSSNYFPLYTLGVQPAIPIIEETPFWKKILGITHPECESCQQYETDLPTPQDAYHLQTYHVANVLDHPQLSSLSASFGKIRSLLIIPLQYHQRCIGCLTLFRQEVTTETLWAGQVNQDERNRLPRQSFKLWREVTKGIPRQWTHQEMKLAQSIGIHVYMSVMERRIKEMLRHQAYHDYLTGLSNRTLFSENLSLALANSHLTRGELVAVLFLDLDGFKRINDTLGHYVGDRLLQQVGKRLVSCLDNAEVVARWGGDEFTILLCPLVNTQKAQTVARQIIAALNVPFHCEGKDLYLKGSIGIAIAPYHGEDTDTLLKHADIALFEAKQQGRNTYQVYTPDLSTYAQQRLALEHSLYKALERSEFLLYYQPQYSLTHNQIIGVEGLLRWQSPEEGWVSPKEFIPLAEETGLIMPIGDWVLQTASEQLQQWHVKEFPPLTISVNLSARQFQDKKLALRIQQLIEQTGINPHQLELEITESIAIQDVSYTIRVLKQLQKIGLKIAMDDFGTGYSSLSALKLFPLDTLKIDKCFINDLTLDDHDVAIVKSIIALGHGLGLTVVAEGVETRNQLEFLRSLHCDIVQGYCISRPLAMAEIEQLIENQPLSVQSP